jgi:hypothetical protein
VQFHKIPLHEKHTASDKKMFTKMDRQLLFIPIPTSKFNIFIATTRELS